MTADIIDLSKHFPRRTERADAAALLALEAIEEIARELADIDPDAPLSSLCVDDREILNYWRGMVCDAVASQLMADESPAQNKVAATILTFGCKFG